MGCPLSGINGRCGCVGLRVRVGLGPVNPSRVHSSLIMDTSSGIISLIPQSPTKETNLLDHFFYFRVFLRLKLKVLNKQQLCFPGNTSANN